jgi:hypothetical protein
VEQLVRHQGPARRRLPVVDSSIEVWLLHDGHRVELVGDGRPPRCVNPAAPSILRIVR